MLSTEDKQLLKNLKCLYDFREDIVTYYNIVDRTHQIKGKKLTVELAENETMTKQGEQSINVLSGVLVDLLVNGKIGVTLNDVGYIPSMSDIQLSNWEYLEVKRIPIGTNSYDLSVKPKFLNFEPEEMTLSDVVDYVKYKIKEYTPVNLNYKQKADYISFYFAVSNIDLYNKSIEEIQQELSEQLQDVKGVFKDVFFIFNKVSIYNSDKVDYLGETVCISLNSKKHCTLVFNIPTLKDKKSESINNVKKIYLSFNKNNNLVVLIKGEEIGVGLKLKDKIYGYGGIGTLVFMVDYITKGEKCCNVSTVEDEDLINENKCRKYYFIGCVE